MTFQLEPLDPKPRLPRIGDVYLYYTEAAGRGRGRWIRCVVNDVFPLKWVEEHFILGRRMAPGWWAEVHALDDEGDGVRLETSRTKGVRFHVAGGRREWEAQKKRHNDRIDRRVAAQRRKEGW